MRHEYNSLIEELKARHQLRAASLERRLQAHQDAFTHWVSLLTEPEKSAQPIIDCQSWWDKNCLNLEPKVRQAFADAYKYAHLRAELVRTKAEADSIKEAWDKVLAFQNVLFDSIQLPSLTPTEVERI